MRDIPVRAKRFLTSVLADAKTIRALVGDPVESRSYYPESMRKSRAAILGDLLWWWLRFGEANRYYYLYGLDRRGADAGSVMAYRRFRALRNSRNLRPDNLSAYYGVSYNFVCVARDKLLFSQVASSLGLPVPRIWAICSPDSVFWLDSDRQAPLDDLVSDPDLRIDGVCKPADGIMGADVFLLKIEGGRLFVDGAEASVGELARRLSPRHLLQSRVVQHPDMAALHPHSINTLRLVTFNRGGAVELFSAALRIGTGGRRTDNWAGGGVLASVDRDSGVVKGDGYLKPAFGRRVARHPDTGVTLDGFQVPEFERAVAMAKRFHRHLPGIHSLGWDIAFTPEGPVFLEANDDWDGIIPMLMEPDFRRKFLAMY
jgi:hypothetical protein